MSPFQGYINKMTSIKPRYQGDANRLWHSLDSFYTDFYGEGNEEAFDELRSDLTRGRYLHLRQAFINCPASHERTFTESPFVWTTIGAAEAKPLYDGIFEQILLSERPAEEDLRRLKSVLEGVLKPAVTQ